MLVKLVVRTPRKLSELVAELLFAAGAGGIEELDGARRLIVYAESREAAEAIRARAHELLTEAAPGAHGVVFNVEVDEHSDWESAWTRHLGQVALTPNLVIQPAWDETEPPPGSHRIRFEPKLSFGDGAHATTRLAAQALERACRARRGVRVLDFGSGTGVLCFVALLSGAEFAWGVDIDPVSVAAAERNAALNELDERARFSQPNELEEGRFDLVVANLEAPTLLSCQRELARLAQGSEGLLLTGFLGAREAEMRAAFAPGFSVVRAEYEADWALLELVPSRE